MKLKAKVVGALVEDRIRAEGVFIKISRAEAVAMVADRLCAHAGDRQAMRNRIRTHFARASRKVGDLLSGRLEALATGLYVANHVIRWADSRFPGKFSDLPFAPINLSISVTSTAETSSGITLDEYPGDEEGLILLVRQLRRLIEANVIL